MSGIQGRPKARTECRRRTRGRRFPRIATVGLVIALTGGAASHAAPFFQTGFETADHAGYVVEQQLTGFDGWTPVIFTPGATRNGEAVTSDALVRSGSQAGHIYGMIDPDVSLQTRLNLVLGSKIEASSLAPGEFVRYEISIALANEESGFLFYTSYRTGWSGSFMGVSFRLVNDGRAQGGYLTDGQKYMTEIGDLQTGKFYDYTLDLHFNASEPYYSVRIDDPTGPNSWEEDFPFRNPQDGLEALNFLVVSGNDGAHMDDIRITIIPEPGTLVLASMAALALLGRRWRSRSRH